MGCSQSTPKPRPAAVAKPAEAPLGPPTGNAADTDKKLQLPSSGQAAVTSVSPSTNGNDISKSFPLDPKARRGYSTFTLTNPTASAPQAKRASTGKFSDWDLSEGKSAGSPEDEHDEPRRAIYDKQDFSGYEKVSYDKSDAVRDLIYDSIKENVLFEQDTKEEMLAIVDIFRPVEFKAGDYVIKQGEDGDEFYVVETGALSINVAAKASSGEDCGDSGAHVGDYGAGAAFGELALIFGNPRAATIKATSDCKLWSLDRRAYRSVIHQLRHENHQQKVAFLRTCVVGGQAFTELFDWQQMEDLAIATKVDSHDDGNVVLREGEVGDTFYILKSGRIEVSKGGRVEKSLEQGGVFGTSSLLNATASKLTYTAAGPVELYYLRKDDFEMLMGSVTDVLARNTVAGPLRNTRVMVKEESRRMMKTVVEHRERVEVELEDLEHFNVLGQGAFGHVKLVQSKKTKKVFALKAQGKKFIADMDQKDHVLSEYRIMKEFTGYSTILGVHCALQDSKYLYLLLDLLPGE